jgi:hypothetical protein
VVPPLRNACAKTNDFDASDLFEMTCNISVIAIPKRQSSALPAIRAIMAGGQLPQPIKERPKVAPETPTAASRVSKPTANQRLPA